MSDMYTVLDEAFALVMLYNKYDRWKEQLEIEQNPSLEFAHKEKKFAILITQVQKSSKELEANLDFSKWVLLVLSVLGATGVGSLLVTQEKLSKLSCQRSTVAQ